MSAKNIQEELQCTLNNLKIEKTEDQLQYRLKMQNTSPIVRRKEGVCWYPVIMQTHNFDAGERLIVSFIRHREHNEPHQFQSGKPVTVFSNFSAENPDEAVTGVVNIVRDDEIMLTLNCDDLPDWMRHGKIGVQLLFDENAYREMEYAVKTLINTVDDRLIRLRNVLLGKHPPSFNDSSALPLNRLNESQNQALLNVINANDLAIIHGPPGTGKTTTLIESIIETIKIETCVLVCAPSNAAVDLLVDKLSVQSINVLRIGHPARVTEHILAQTLDARVAHHHHYKDLKMIRKKADEYRNIGQKYKRNFGYAEREQRKLLYAEARKLSQEADQLNFYIISDILSKAQVIATTLVGASNYVLKGMRFKTLFIDEASQGLEPATWIPVLKAERVILAGDHCQLPPTVKSYEAAQAGFSETLFEKAILRTQASTLLCEQYRMHEKIMNFSSRIFYNSNLIANTQVANWKVFEEDEPIEFIDTAGCGFFEQIEEETMSSYNPEEATLLFKHLQKYLETIKEILPELSLSIGIISPYKAQVLFLQELLNTSIDEQFIHQHSISVNTIDSFQGQERDVIYISLVRSNENGEIGFLSDVRRMNVAMTRARKKLVMFGDSATICRNIFYNKLLDYVNEVESYHSAFEYLY